MCGQFNQTSVWYPDDDEPKLICEMFDKGATTFDLHDTTFYHPEDLFEKIKNSHEPRYDRKEIIERYKQAGLWNTYKSGRDIMYEEWEQEDQSNA